MVQLEKRRIPIKESISSMFIPLERLISSELDVLWAFSTMLNKIFNDELKFTPMDIYIRASALLMATYHTYQRQPADY